MTSRQVNPLNPDSVGGLLAEEWTINPHSTLPSFLEMAMIEESQRVAWNTVKTIFDHLQNSLNRWSHITTENESFMHTLFSRLKLFHVIRFLSENILSVYGPEIRFGIFYLLERKSLLSESAATISEALQGGKRVKLCTGTADNKTDTTQYGSRQAKLIPLTKHDGIRLALLIPLGRYLLERGELIHRKMTDYQVFSGSSTPLQNLLLFVYPFLYSSAKGLNLLQRWRYLLGQSVFFDSYSKWLNLVVRRVVMEDSRSHSVSTRTDKANAVDDNTNYVLQLALRSQNFKRIVQGLLVSTLGISWLVRLRSMRQQLRWRQLARDGSMSLPLPPKPLPNLSIPVRCPPSHCPLCRSPRVNPTASTSGYVFCLTCLTTALRSSPFCPMTGKACPESSIVRLFEPHGV